MAATLVVVLLFFGRYFPSAPPKYQSIPGSDDHDDEDAPTNPVNGSSAVDLGNPQKLAGSTSSNGFAVWLSRDVLLMLVAFFCCQLSRQFSSVLLQFSSFKFSWDYAQVCKIANPRMATCSHISCF